VRAEVTPILCRDHSIHIVQYDVTINQNYPKEKLKGAAGVDRHQAGSAQASAKPCTLPAVRLLNFDAIC
jgi:hypothetical protein